MQISYLLNKTLNGLFAVVLALFAVSCSDGESPKMTKQEKIFAERWNQWLAEHQEEVNSLRTRVIADDLTKEESSREMIALMVRFSSESKLEIPQRFIDDIKKQGATSKGE
jgi:hypothetical protein